MNSQKIIKAAKSALFRAGAPIAYIHEDGESTAFAAVVEIEHLRKIVLLIPETRAEELTKLVEYHGHVCADDDEKEVEE